MPRRVFFSFHYQEDIWRVNQIRHVGVTKDWETMPFMDAASWEAVKRKGENGIKGWIDRQLAGTGVTVVLIGRETADRKYVKYEIEESHKRGNGMFGIYIDGLKDQNGSTTSRGRNPFDSFTVRTNEWHGTSTTHMSRIYPTYDWVWDNGYQSIGTWIEKAARKAGR